MIIKSLEIANFRKFRDPVRIDGFSDGFNVVIEPNETGKSTLLEALRAAFFIRHSANTELVRSFVPIGDDVAPRVAVEFIVRGQPWSLEKQFLKSTFVRLNGNGSRRESDAAEEALQELLGFERGNNRGSDPETRGPLGMLWVEQMSALEVESPNRIVRDTVRGVLEAEVGAVTGGRRFESIRTKVEAAYAAFRAPTTGKSRGELAAAEGRLASASLARQEAEGAYREYEQTLNDLDGAKARLRIIERDLADPETDEQRRKLESDLKLAETASLRLTITEAQYGRAEELLKNAIARLERLETAEARLVKAQDEIENKRAIEKEAQTAVNAAVAEEKRLRAKLDDARKTCAQHEADLTEARARTRAFATAAGVRRAIEARRALGDLEERERKLLEEAALAVDDAVLAKVAQLERDEVTALAKFEAGAVKVDIELAGDAELRIDGAPSDASSIDVLSPTRIEIGSAGSIVVRPPTASGRSMEVDLSAAREALAASLRAIGVASHAAGVARNERAASAMRELIALRKQIAAACPGDPTIGLAAGADALRAFVAEQGEIVQELTAPDDNLDVLETELTNAKIAEAAATAIHDESRTILSKAENALATALADLLAATRELDAAKSNLSAVLEDADRVRLEIALGELQRDRADKLDLLHSARDAAKAFDIEAIKRRLDNINRATARAGDERLELTGRIAALEATIAREGVIGPAGRVAEAREEEIAATSALGRLQQEADTFEVLRKTLADAASDASRTFLAPVTRRAARYVERLLPGSELSFTEELGLAGVSRAGMNEACGGLSRGTQEQLAILTRLAFADLLLEDGKPISLILDDPLVYSDDERLETMTDILEEAAQRMQVILLTCRSKAFRHVDGNRITLR